MAAGAQSDPFDLLVVGGGVHGAAVARDAAGRGLSVLLCERDDLASATSSASSKLIHGGLRYLEHGGFRLVREALAEREVLMATAPHLVQPLRFVLPRAPGVRPDWMVRTGLWLYDKVGGPMSLPRSKALRLTGTPYGAALKPEYERGYVYSDCRTDDARLTLAHARGAAALGARIETRTEVVAAVRESGAGTAGADGTSSALWRITLERRPPVAAAASPSRGARDVWARTLVNAAGPWVERIVQDVAHRPPHTTLHLVKGSHIVVPRLYPGAHAYILQQPDRRIVFVIPYEQDFTLIGTTELEQATPGPVTITDDEVVYLCAAAGLYLAAPVLPESVVWSFAGTRALVGGASGKSASALSREAVLDGDGGESGEASGGDARGAAPMLSIYGGKLTTSRALAERAVESLRSFHPLMGPAWTAGKPLPGGELEAGGAASATGSGAGGSAARLAALIEALRRAHPELHGDLLAALARRHGSEAHALLAGARVQADLGRWFGGDLFERELEWMVAKEWAITADDVLWRRSKAGLRLSGEQRRAVERWMAGRVSGRTGSEE